jgi:hypothetical protein
VYCIYIGQPSLQQECHPNALPQLLLGPAAMDGQRLGEGCRAKVSKQGPENQIVLLLDGSSIAVVMQAVI